MLSILAAALWMGAALITTLIGVLTVAVYRAWSLRPRRYLFSPADLSRADLTAGQLTGSEQRLASGLAIPTISVSREDPPPRGELLHYHQHLKQCFPTVFDSPAVTVEVINELSLLFTVAGTEPSLRPYLLLSHMDVVPVLEQNWKRPPFAGIIEDGNIIGRGAIDVKHTGHAILESLEHRLKTGDLPRRPLIVAFGHDEEVNGQQGAGEIAKVLMKRAVKPLFCIDEGTTIVEKFIPGVKPRLAVVSVCEKGYLTLELTASGDAGHSSIPPLDMAVNRLAAAVARLHPNPQPNLFGRGPEMELLRVAAPMARPLFRLIYANPWLFSPLIKLAFQRNAALRATITTTTAVPILQAGCKENVVPPSARAVVNHRVSPLMSREQVISTDLRAIGDPAVIVRPTRYAAPSPIAPYGADAAPFSLLAATVQQLHGADTMTAPSVMVANSDTRHYLTLTEHVFRFNPIVMQPHELGRFHGDNEMISVENYHNCIRFYYRLMKNMDTDTVVKRMP